MNNGCFLYIVVAEHSAESIFLAVGSDYLLFDKSRLLGDHACLTSYLVQAARVQSWMTQSFKRRSSRCDLLDKPCAVECECNELRTQCKSIDL